MTDGLLYYRNPDDGLFYPVVVGSDAAVMEHEAATNPHPQYVEKASGTSWNSARGVVAVFPKLGTAAVSVAANTLTPISGSLAFTFSPGRRYKICVSIRAITAATAHTSDITVFNGTTDLATAGQALNARWHGWSGGTYSNNVAAFFLDGTGQTYSALTIQVTSDSSCTWYTEDPSRMWIEDIGPITRVAEGDVPTEDDWSSADSRYVQKSGDTVSGSLAIQGVVVGNIWGGTVYQGVQRGASGAGTDSALLLGPSAGASYLTGPVGGTLRLRGAAEIPAASEVVVLADGAMAVNTPWATVSKVSQSVGAASWTAIIGSTGTQTGGFSFGGTNIFVPRAGVYRVTVRAASSVAGRLIVSLSTDGAANYGTQTAWIADARSYVANDVIGGSRLVYITSYFQPYVFINTAGTVSAYTDIEYVGAKNAS